MEHEDHGPPQQQGGSPPADRARQLQQFMQEQKGNDFAWRPRRRRTVTKPQLG